MFKYAAQETLITNGPIIPGSILIKKGGKMGLPRNGGIAAGEIVDLKPVAGI
jgi:hypothetical protein